MIPIAGAGSVLVILYHGLDRTTEDKEKPVATIVCAPIGVSDEDIQKVLKLSEEQDLFWKRKTVWRVAKNTILFALWAPVLFGFLVVLGRIGPGTAIFGGLLLSLITLCFTDLYRKEKESAGDPRSS